jgi:hypothetical protein
MTRRFTCAECGWEGESGWSDEEAQAEALMNGFTPEFLEADGGAVVVCDDCYQKMTAVSPLHVYVAEKLAEFATREDPT